MLNAVEKYLGFYTKAELQTMLYRRVCRLWKYPNKGQHWNRCYW